MCQRFHNFPPTLWKRCCNHILLAGKCMWCLRCKLNHYACMQSQSTMTELQGQEIHWAAIHMNHQTHGTRRRVLTARSCLFIYINLWWYWKQKLNVYPFKFNPFQCFWITRPYFSGWLSPEEADAVANGITRTMTEVTGLNCDQWAEDIQLSVYGIGGMYEPHHDYAQVWYWHITVF